MKIERITKKALLAAIKNEGLGMFVDGKEPVKAAGTTGITMTEKGNYMVYTMNADLKMFNTSVHANRREAFGMALRRLRQYAKCNGTLLVGA